MAFSFADAKARLRRAVHDTLAVDALYTDSSVNDFEPVCIKARYHNKLELSGDPNNEGFAQMLQGIDRIVLIPSDYPGLTFKRGDTIEFPAYALTFMLGETEPSDGPLRQVWHVVAR